MNKRLFEFPIRCLFRQVFIPPLHEKVSERTCARPSPPPQKSPPLPSPHASVHECVQPCPGFKTEGFKAAVLGSVRSHLCGLSFASPSRRPWCHVVPLADHVSQPPLFAWACCSLNAFARPVDVQSPPRPGASPGVSHDTAKRGGLTPEPESDTKVFAKTPSTRRSGAAPGMAHRGSVPDTGDGTREEEV